MLSVIIFLPILGAIAVMLLPKKQEQNAKYLAAVITLVNLALTLAVYIGLDQLDSGLQYSERTTWISAADVGFKVQYFVGVDGLSATMLLLTGLLFFVATLISWRIELRPKEYFGWLLALETAVAGVFAAQDLMLFFLFYEVIGGIASAVDRVVVDGVVNGAGRATRQASSALRYVQDGQFQTYGAIAFSGLVFTAIVVLVLSPL